MSTSSAKPAQSDVIFKERPRVPLGCMGEWKNGWGLFLTDNDPSYCRFIAFAYLTNRGWLITSSELILTSDNEIADHLMKVTGVFEPIYRPSSLEEKNRLYHQIRFLPAQNQA